MRILKKTTHASLFPSGLCVNLHSSDAKEMEEQSVFWPYEHKQFSKGKFHGKIVAVHTGRLQLSFTSRSTGVIVRGSIPSETTNLTLPVSMEHSIFYRGHALRDHEIVALNSDEEYEVQTSLPTSVVTVAVKQVFFERQCLEVTGNSFEQLRYQERLFIDPKGYDRCTGQLLTLLQTFQSSPHTPSAWEAELIEKTILEIILSGVRAPGIVLKMPARLCVAKKTENYIRENLKNSISIPELCRIAGTSERTLHHGFKERYGISPKAYMLRLRLNGVRQDLLANRDKKPVSDSAVQWGFFHFGRFSAQYKQMFGELPSKTQKI